MLLDVQTLTFAGGFVSLASGLLVLFYWWQDRTANSALCWGVGTSGAGVGIFLLALHGVVSHFVSDIAGPLLLDVCAVVPWVTARLFNRRSVSVYLVLTGIGIWILMEVGAGALVSDQLATVLGTTISGCAYGAGAVEFWRSRDEQLRGRWPMISVLGLFAIALFLASAGFLLSTSSGPLPSINWFGIIHFVGLAYAIVGAMSLVTMLKERSEKLYKAAALTDPLTGLPNRRAFMDRAQRLLDRSAADDKHISLLALDLDRFKSINDKFGHAMGDRVLRIFADGLSWTLRPADIAGRIGGEEFAVALPGSDGQTALAIADRIRSAFEASARLVDGQRVGATVSIGVASSLGSAWNLTAILESADGALYRAKSLGRNRIVSADYRDDVEPTSNIIKVA